MTTNDPRVLYGMLALLLACSGAYVFTRPCRVRRYGSRVKRVTAKPIPEAIPDDFELGKTRQCVNCVHQSEGWCLRRYTLVNPLTGLPPLGFGRVECGTERGSDYAGTCSVAGRYWLAKKPSVRPCSVCLLNDAQPDSVWCAECGSAAKGEVKP